MGFAVHLLNLFLYCNRLMNNSVFKREKSAQPAEEHNFHVAALREIMYAYQCWKSEINKAQINFNFVLFTVFHLICSWFLIRNFTALHEQPNCSISADEICAYEKKKKEKHFCHWIFVALKRKWIWLVSVFTLLWFYINNNKKYAYI